MRGAIKAGKRIAIALMSLLVIYLVWPTGDAPEQKISTLILYTVAFLEGAKALLATWSKLSAMLKEYQ